MRDATFTGRRTGRPKVSEGLARAGEGAALPQKKFFRSRAHINPLNKTPAEGCELCVWTTFARLLLPGLSNAACSPPCPDAYDWAKHFPTFADPADPEHRRLLPCVGALKGGQPPSCTLAPRL